MFGIACFGGTPLLGSESEGGGGGPSSAIIRDDVVMQAARDLIEVTGAFGRVECGTDLYDYRHPTDIKDYCLIYRGEWKEKDDATSFDGDDSTLDIPHMGFFFCVVGYRHDDKAARLNHLSKLESIVMNVLDGSTLNGLVYGTFTKVVEGKPLRSVFPNAGTQLKVEYQWIVGGADGHDETDCEAFQ